MIKTFFPLLLFMFLFSGNGYARRPEVIFHGVKKNYENIGELSLCGRENSAIMMGNPNSWWNRSGKKICAFTGVFAAGVGIGIGVGSIVPGIGTTSGAIIGVVGGVMGGIAVLHHMRTTE